MTPAGHSLAAAALLLWNRKTLEACPAPRTLAALTWFAALAPDLDLLPFVPLPHRGPTHSLLAVALLLAPALLALFVALAQRTDREGARRWMTRAGLLLLCAGGSHLLLDYYTADFSSPFGQQLLWPFSGRYYEAGTPLFPFAFRNRLWCMHNMLTFLVEVHFGLLLCLSAFLARRPAGLKPQ